MKKILAAIMALCIVGGTYPAVEPFSPQSAITARAAEGDYNEVTEDKLTFNVYEDHAEIVRCDTNATGEIVIPSEIKGVPVTSIGFEAFRQCKSLESIVISNSVTSIGEYAFADCSNIKELTLPNKIKEISYCSFYGCESLKSITIPDSVTKIDNLAFWNCTSLESVVFPKTLTDINAQSFSDTPWLDAQQKKSPYVIVNNALVNGWKSSANIEIPANVTTICDLAFSSRDDITSVVIPSNVKSIGGAFAYCQNLEIITVLNPECELVGGFVTNYLDWLTPQPTPRFRGTICGYENSTAQAYAKKYGVNFKSLGKYGEVKYPKTTEGFVTRMYNVALNREPDTAGLNSWVKKLNNHTATAADIINGFFFSSEYQGKNKTADQMIEDCYKAMLDRAPDATGRTNWKNRLSVGMSIQSICKGFVGSSEFKGLCDYYKITPGSITPKYARDENYERTYFIYRLYKNCLGRNPSASEVENWCKQIKAGKTGSSIAYGFIFSKEYKGKNVSNSAFVDMLYRTILGRGGDSNGVKSWTAKLNAKATRESVFNGFLFSTEFKNQCDKAGIKVGSKV